MQNTELLPSSVNRRQFIHQCILAGLASTVLAPKFSSCNNPLTQDQIDWDKVRSQFPIINWDKLYFNSGSAGVMPQIVLDNLLELVQQMNQIPPYKAWGLWADIRKENLNRLATLLNVNAQEIEMVRNTTEALNMIIYGLPLKAGDQVLYSKNDYPFAKNAWQNRAIRDGIELIEVDYTLPASDEEIIAAYKKALSPNVKIIHCTYITHGQGHILPVAALTNLAHQNNAQIVVDGAHCLGQIPVDIKTIGCDYFATSLHKWLNAPHGTGLLFVKENLITNLYNHPSSYIDASDTINKYEHLGTRAFHQEIGVAAALDFHDALGPAKYDRLQILKQYWTSKLAGIDNLIFHTDLSTSASAAITTFQIKGKYKQAGQCLKVLSEDYNIHAKTTSGDWGDGIRISVNVFTSFEDLDHLADAIQKIATS